MKEVIILALAAAAVAISGTASATDYSEAKAACAAAIADKSGKALDGAQSKLLKARNRGAALVSVEVIFADGAKTTGDCKVRRGAVEELSIAG